MGLATNDSQSQREHTEIHKIPKFGDLKTSKFTKKCMASGGCVGQRPDCHTFLCKFGNFQMAVSCLRLGLFTPNLGILQSFVCTL